LRNVLGYKQVYGGDLPAAVWAGAMRGTIDGLRLPVAAMPVPDDTEPDPPKQLLPDVVGRNVAAARALLTAQGFKVTVQEIIDAAPPGTVLAMDPPGNQEVLAGSNVALTVSQGLGLPPRPDNGDSPVQQPAAGPAAGPLISPTGPGRRRGDTLFGILGEN